MRKLRVFESISVDGYFTDANGDMSWAHAGREREFGRRTAIRAQDLSDDGGLLANADGSTADARCRQGDERSPKIRRVEDHPTNME